METVEHYRKNVVTVRSDATVPELAETMREQGVGCVVVVGEDGAPLGMVTDRDLTIRVIAGGRLASKTPASAIMSHPLRTVSPSYPLDEVVEILRANGIRRVPVVQDKELVGIVALDDLLVALAEELTDLAEATRYEIDTAQRKARLQAVRREARDRLGAWFDQLETLGEGAKDTLMREFDALREWVRAKLQ